MKFAYFLSTLPALALAEKTFGALTVRSGSQFQYGALSVKDGLVHINDGQSNIEWVLKDDGSLWDANSKKYLVVNEKGELSTSDEPEKMFAVSENHLWYDAESGFYACPSDDGNKYILAKKECQDGTPLVVYVTGIKNVNEPTPEPTVTKTLVPTPIELTTTLTPISIIKGNKKTITLTTTKKIEPTAVAASKDNFGLVAIRSGSQFQNLAIKKTSPVFQVGGSEGDDLTLTLSTDGALYDQDGRGVFVNENGDLGNVDPWGQQLATQGFLIKDGNLYYQDEQSFYACPGGENKFSLTVKGWDGCTGIQLKVFE